MKILMLEQEDMESIEKPFKCCCKKQVFGETPELLILKPVFVF